MRLNDMPPNALSSVDTEAIGRLGGKKARRASLLSVVSGLEGYAAGMSVVDRDEQLHRPPKQDMRRSKQLLRTVLSSPGLTATSAGLSSATLASASVAKLPGVGSDGMRVSHTAGKPLYSQGGSRKVFGPAGENRGVTLWNAAPSARPLESERPVTAPGAGGFALPRGLK